MFQRIAMLILEKKQAKFLTVRPSTPQAGAVGRTCSRASPTCTLWLSSTASASQTPACRRRRGQESVPVHNQHHIWAGGCSHWLSVNAEMCWPHQEHFGVESGRPRTWVKVSLTLLNIRRLCTSGRQIGQVIFNQHNSPGPAISKGIECQELHSYIQNILLEYVHSVHTCGVINITCRLILTSVSV